MLEEETVNSKKLFRRRLKKNISDDDSDRVVSQDPVKSDGKGRSSDKEDLPTASSSKQNPVRQIRRIKRKVLDDLEAELGSESEEQARDRDDENFALDERVKRMKKRILKTRPKKDYDSDKELFSDDSNSNKKKKKREVNTQARKPKKAQKARQELAANLVKTSNKLIGEIENNDIYGVDDDHDGFNTGFGNGGICQAFDLDEDYRGQNIQIDIGPTVKKDDEKKFLKKMKSKKEQEEQKQGLETEIVNLGMLVEPGQVSANELAAKGIQLSVREHILKQTSLAVENPGSFSNNANQPAVVAPATAVTSGAKPEEEEDTGLMFYDPKAESRAQMEKELREKQRNRQNLMKEGTSAGIHQIQAMGVKKVQNKRLDLLTQLKNQTVKNITIDKLKATFECTDYNDNKKQLAKDLEKAALENEEMVQDEDDDSEFNEEEHLKEEQAQGGIWDDEENVIQHQDEEEAEVPEDEEEGEEEQMSQIEQALAASSQTGSVKKQEEAAPEVPEVPVDEEMPIQRLKRKPRNEKSGASSQISMQKKKKKIKAAFFEEEAELGSDQEGNDDIRKKIDKNDHEEVDDGLDSDLADFVVHEDDEVVHDADVNAHAKYLVDMADDDKKRLRQVMQETIFGHNNKKRKRNEVDGLDNIEMDDFERRKLERLQEREQELNSQDEEQMQQDLLEGGRSRAMERKKMKELAEEEELSEDEINQQLENQRYFNFMKEKTKKDQLRLLEKRQKEQEQEVATLIVDLNKKKTTADVVVQPQLKKYGSTLSKKFDKGVSLKHQQNEEANISKAQSAGENENLKKKSYKPTGSMSRFFQSSVAANTNEIKAKLKANNKTAVPMLFKQKK